MQDVPLRDGETLRVRIIGQGPPVVLLHGYASQSLHWLPNVLPLAHKYRFILPDFRGFGHSAGTHLARGNAFETYADDLHDVLDYLDIDQAVLGGISTGAYTALSYNKKYGFDRISHYMNIEHCAQSRNGDDWEHGIFGDRQAEIFQQFDSLLNDWFAFGDHKRFWDIPTDVRLRMTTALLELVGQSMGRDVSKHMVRLASFVASHRAARVLAPMDNWATYVKLMEAFMIGNDTRPALSSISIPTTLMIGERSELFNVEGQLDIARRVKHARIVRFPKAGHVPQLDQPLRFQRELTRFLAQSQTPQLQEELHEPVLTLPADTLLDDAATPQ